MHTQSYRATAFAFLFLEHIECTFFRASLCQDERLELLGKLEQLPLKVRTEEQEGLLQGLTNAELAMWLDLRPYMQRTPFVVQGNASLARAYRLFRTMGLHHLFVATPKPQVIGLITRKVCPVSAS